MRAAHNLGTYPRPRGTTRRLSRKARCVISKVQTCTFRSHSLYCEANRAADGTAWRQRRTSLSEMPNLLLRINAWNKSKGNQLTGHGSVTGQMR
jgi:hypothetical protein